MIRSHPLYPTELQAHDSHYTSASGRLKEASMSTQAGHEVEVKIRVENAAEASDRLASKGFVTATARQFEANTLYDTSDQKLRQAGMLLRLRENGRRNVITWKGPSVPGPHKSRPELETTVASLETLDQMLRQLGYQPMFRYEKYRTEFVHPGEQEEGTVTLDETPIGTYMELEGAAEWIDRTAKSLGFREQDYVLQSYGALYQQECAQRGVAAKDMVFAQSGV
jgi:adenylate cyclase class 2